MLLTQSRSHARHARLFELLRQENLSEQTINRIQTPAYAGTVNGPTLEWQYLAAQSLTRPAPKR
ncbi:hypothetical protein [Primorskyibacter sp. S87]|uniref:hypothetical protein n=1 Tax=Primorskyibacter sp. S87 TaxID=3415126 RepID=UPI003C7A6DA7